MKVQTIKVKWAENELSQNTHIVEYEDGCILIDAGCSLEEVKQITDKPIKAILITHAHFDHIKSIAQYDSSRIKIYAHKSVLEVLNNETNNASILFNEPKKFKLNNLYLLEDQEELDFGTLNIQCLYTPGHSIDSMCYLINNEILFSGDTVFSVAVGRDDLPTSNTTKLIESLNKILNLNYISLFAGHGRPSDKNEQKTNIPKWINYLTKAKSKIL